MRGTPHGWAPALALVLALAPTPRGSARADVAASPDVAANLSGTTVLDRETAIDDLMGGIAIEAFGGLPEGADVDAYHEEPGGEVLFSTDTTVSLPGGLVAAKADAVRYAGGGYALAFDASDPDGSGTGTAVPEGADLDALTRDPANGDLILSFDVSVDLGFVADDEDLVRFDGTAFSLELDTSALALSSPFDPDLDLDAVSARGGGIYALSFDGSGSAGGVAFDDEDVLEVVPSLPTVGLAFDASAAHAGWSVADGDAVMLPEPGVAAALAAGVLLLAALRWRRVRS